MIIRKAQIDELSQGAKSAFEDEMVAHLAEFSPPLFKVIKEEQMREAVRFGVSQADNYGFNLRGPIRLYLESMLLFGSHFDTDPQYPWAGEILKNQNSSLQMNRADSIYEKIINYQEKVSGENAVNTRKALKELLVFAGKPINFSSNNFPTAMRQEMARIFPQKTNYIGEDALTALIQEGRAEAQKYRFPTVRGEVLIVALMFAFGHGCTDDLLYPWIARTLKDEKIIDPAARAERLEKKAVTWLEHVLAQSNGGTQS